MTVAEIRAATEHMNDVVTAQANRPQLPDLTG
jgi:hypothetical protein